MSIDQINLRFNTKFIWILIIASITSLKCIILLEKYENAEFFL